MTGQIQRVDHLKRKHQELDEEIKRKSRSRATPGNEISDLKKRKLKLKEEIVRLTS